MTWYVQTADGKQYNPGRDQRFKTPPVTKPKEPPADIPKKYLAVMQRTAEPEDRTLSSCIGEHLGSLADCTDETRYQAGSRSRPWPFAHSQPGVPSSQRRGDRLPVPLRHEASGQAGRHALTSPPARLDRPEQPLDETAPCLARRTQARLPLE